MASLIYLDTHVAAWLFAGRTDLLPQAVQTLLDEHDLLVSPVVQLELQYLHEIGRTAEPGRVVIDTLKSELGLRVCDLPFGAVIEVAMDQTWTRDPFDRLIVSQAMAQGAALVTKDKPIRDHFPKATWGEP